jgi:hypothetical protein
MRTFFSTSVAFGALFSGCLAISPGSVILTIDASFIDEDSREKLTEVGVFVCDEGSGDDCSQAENYIKFATIPVERGLKDKETLGLALKDFTGPLQVHIIAGDSATNFDEPNNGDLVAQAEATVDVEARTDLVLPLRLLPSPDDILDIPVTAGADVTDLSILSCNVGSPFVAVWSENVANDANLLGINIEADGSLSDVVEIVPLQPAVGIFEVALAADPDCDNLGFGVLALNRTDAEFNVQGATIPVANVITYQTTAAATGQNNNLTASFGENGLAFTWDQLNIADTQNNSSFFQEANEANFTAVGTPDPLRPGGGTFVTTVSNTGGIDGATVFLSDDDLANGVEATVTLIDNRTGDEVEIAQPLNGHFAFDPEVAILDSARILVAWFDCQGSDCSIVGRIVDRAGNDVSGSFPAPAAGVPGVCEEPGCFLIAEEQTNPFQLSLGVGSDGGFVVSWNFQEDSGNQNAFELQAAFFGTAGPRLNPYSGAANAASISPLDGDDFFQGDAQTIVTAAGDVVISWVDTENVSVAAAAAGVAAKLSTVRNALAPLKPSPR